MGVETGTASCFNLLAADRQQRRPFASPTSPLKTRVRGFYGCSSGRFSSRRRRSRAIATGCGACGYKTASGRSKWVNRDPLGEGGFIVLQLHKGFMSAGLARRMAELSQGPNLYRFWENDLVNNVDAAGLQGVIAPSGPPGSSIPAWDPGSGTCPAPPRPRKRDCDWEKKMCDVRGIIVTGAADIAGSVLGLNPITGGVIATGVGVDYYSVCEKQYQQCVNDNINNGYY